MKRAVFSLVVILAFAVFSGCGSSNKPTVSKLSITPTSISVKTGQLVQFTATSTDNPSPAVNWTVNDVGGGSLSIGTIDVTGRYIAPATVPNPAKVTVKATLATDATQVASAAVTISQGDALTITITPTPEVSVAAGQTQQFTATIANTANTNVVWSVAANDGKNNFVVGGDSTNGTIDQNGMYSAPAAVVCQTTTTGGTTTEVCPKVIVQAAAQADTTKTATVLVNLMRFTYISVKPGVVAALPAGGTQQFTADLNGQPMAAAWALHCNSDAAEACGSIDANGLYSAPFSPPLGRDVNITAASPSADNCTSGHDCIHAGGATVTVTFANGSLTGKYALSFSGKNASGAYTAIGSIAFDGASNVTGGELDIDNAGTSHVAVTGGTYNIGTDGRGVLTLTTADGEVDWRIAVANHSQAYVMSKTATGLTGSGTLDFQDPAAFDVAKITGAYALSVAGPDVHNAATFAEAGAVSADGAGQITGGVVDINNAGDVQANVALTSASYTAPSSNGRGTMTLTSSFGTQDFVYYINDANHLKLLATGAQPVAGNLTKQAAGPFSTVSFQGAYAFVFTGSNGGHPLGRGGVFRLDGAGALTTGTTDINNNGNVTSAQGMIGTYNVADTATGRTTLTVTVNGADLHYVIYPQMDGVNVIGSDATEVTSGMALAQDDSNFGAGTITGTYALSLAGADLTSNPGEETVLGQIMPNGATSISGVLDINDNAGDSAVSLNTPLNAADYQVKSNAGRYSATLPTAWHLFQSAAFNVYAVDRAGNRALWLETDSNRVLSGVMQKQY